MRAYIVNVEVEGGGPALGRGRVGDPVEAASSNWGLPGTISTDFTDDIFIITMIFEFKLL